MVAKTISEETERHTIVLSLGASSKIRAVQGDIIARSRKSLSFSKTVEWCLFELFDAGTLSEITNTLVKTNIQELRAKNDRRI